MATAFFLSDSNSAFKVSRHPSIPLESPQLHHRQQQLDHHERSQCPASQTRHKAKVIRWKAPGERKQPPHRLGLCRSRFRWIPDVTMAAQLLPGDFFRTCMATPCEHGMTRSQSKTRRCREECRQCCGGTRRRHTHTDTNGDHLVISRNLSTLMGMTMQRVSLSSLTNEHQTF